jgi:hypothetical protein
MTDPFVWVVDLTRINKLALLDVLEDMQNELQMNPSNPSIPLMPQVIKHIELFPGDSVGMRDNYMEKRYKAAQSLAQHGVIGGLNVTSNRYGHRWDSQLEFSADETRINQLVNVLRSFFRSKSNRGQRVMRYASHIVSFAAGISLAVSVTREVWWLWLLTGALAIGLAASLGAIPRWKGTLRAIADWATVVAAVAAVMGLIWTILHTPAARP